MASSGDGPRKADAGRLLPICTAWNADPASRSPSVRSSHPVRSDDPGAARSISSIASKCERVWFAMPTAWTAPNVPASHHGISGCIAGWIPNIGSSGSRAFCGIPIDGRTSAYRGSPVGTIVLRPSKPPRSESTTSTSPV